MTVSIKIPHDKIRDSNTISHIIAKEFRKKGVNVEKNEVMTMNDDFRKGIRHIEAKNTQYFFQGGR